MSKIDLKQEMLRDAKVIIQSIDFLEILIDDKTTQFEQKINDGDFTKAESLKKEVYQLLAKLHNEELEMDKYMIKYTKKVKDTQDNL